MKIASRKDSIDEAKIELAVELAMELDQLVDKIDAFLEYRIAAEFDELRADIEALVNENKQLKEDLAIVAIEKRVNAAVRNSIQVLKE